MCSTFFLQTPIISLNESKSSKKSFFTTAEHGNSEFLYHLTWEQIDCWLFQYVWFLQWMLVFTFRCLSKVWAFLPFLKTLHILGLVKQKIIISNWVHVWTWNFLWIYSRTIEKPGAKFGVLSSTLGCFLNPMNPNVLRDVSIKINNFWKKLIIFHLILNLLENLIMFHDFVMEGKGYGFEIFQSIF